MVYELGILNILILFGAFQGFLLAFILVSTKRLKKTSNYFLALLLASLALLNVASTMDMPPSGVKTYFVHHHPFFIVNLIPPAVHFFIKYLTEPNYNWRRIDYLFFVPFIVELLLRLYKYSFYLNGKILSQSEMGRLNFWENTLELFCVIFTITIIILSIKSLKQYEQNLYENYADVKAISLKWLRQILIAGLILCAVWFVVTITDYEPMTFSINLAMLTLLGLSFFICWIGYSMIIRQELLDTPVFAISSTSETIQKETSELSSKADEYYLRLKKLMETDKIYENTNLNMTILSEKTNISNSYLSQIINQKEGKNFFDFVNGYRIESVKEKMLDPKFSHYTILALAQEAGFKSKSTFNSYFKKATGLTPSAYRKSHL